MSRLTILSEVVLPQPDGPTRMQILPAGTVSDRSLTAPGVGRPLLAAARRTLRDVVEFDDGAVVSVWPVIGRDGPPGWASWRDGTAAAVTVRISDVRRYWPVPAHRGVKITAIRLDRVCRVPLDPPFPAAWDPVPRTVVRGRRSSGSRPTRASSGIGSGDTMDGFEAFEHLFIGQDPLAIARHVRALETIDFHAGRYWPLEVALWDIAGQVAGLPVATLFGGRVGRHPGLRVVRDRCCRAAARAESALRLREEGFRALKIRVDPRGSRTGIAAVAATRARGRRHDGDHGRPQPGLADGRRHDRARSTGRRRARSPPASPSSTSSGSRSRSTATDLRGLAALRAAGARDPDRRRRDDADVRRELVAALDADAFDVYQPDVVLAAGMLRGRGRVGRAGAGAKAAGSRRTPGRTGSACWPTSTSPPASAAGRSSSSRTTRPAGPPSGATPCSPSRSGPDPDGILRVPQRPGLGRRARRGRHRAVRGMTDLEVARRSTTGSRARRRSQPRTEAFIDGRFVPAASGRTFDDIAGATARRSREVAEGDAEDVDRPSRAARALVRRPPLGGPVAEEPQARPAPARRADPGGPRASSRCSSRSTSASRSATRSRSTSRAARRRSSGTPRRSTRSTARSARPGRRRCRS